MVEEKTAGEVMEEYRDENKIYCLEGDRGLKALNNICQSLGYREQIYRQGSALEEFLRDNSDCCEKIIEWITEQMEDNEEWKQSLSFDDDEEPEVEEKITVKENEEDK